ncbi:hypothetical protein EYR40_006646 [Pleurotus pulmonarius]|nr:hypothetical protein EYR40_006646 [Pleurotus pulmonarius]
MMFFFNAVVSLCAVVVLAAPLRTCSKLGARDDDLPARIPYIFPAPGTDPLADAIRERHGTLLDVDGLLLNAPKLAAGLNDLFGAIRGENSLPGNMRELIILRIAVLNSAAYQWLQHEPFGRAEGLATEQLRAIRFTPPFFQTKHSKRVFGGLKEFMNDQQIVEATITAAGYNLVSRFVVALDADAKMDVPVPVV